MLTEIEIMYILCYHDVHCQDTHEISMCTEYACIRCYLMKITCVYAYICMYMCTHIFVCTCVHNDRTHCTVHMMPCRTYLQ